MVRDRRAAHALIPEGQQLDVLVPARAAVVLQADVAVARVVLPDGAGELVRGAIGALVGFAPFVEVHPRNQLAVEFHGDLRAVADDDRVVPLPGRLHGVAAGRDQVVQGAGVVQAGAGGIVDGHLDAVEADVLARLDRDRKGPHEDAAVAALWRS